LTALTTDLWIGQGDLSGNSTIAGLRSKLESAYGKHEGGPAVRIEVTNSNCVCQSSCSITAKCDEGRRNWMQFIKQFHNVHSAWQMLLEHEAGVGRQFDWVIKVRNDMLWFDVRQLRHLDLLDGSIFVPEGIMTGVNSYQDLNDHVFVCKHRVPNRCERYFTEVPRAYQRCVEGEPWRKELHPFQRLMFGRAPKCSQSGLGGECVDSESEGLESWYWPELLRLGYTLARVNSGPACDRLNVRPAAVFMRDYLPICQKFVKDWNVQTTAASAEYWESLSRTILDTNFTPAPYPSSDQQKKKKEEKKASYPPSDHQDKNEKKASWRTILDKYMYGR